MATQEEIQAGAQALRAHLRLPGWKDIDPKASPEERARQSTEDWARVVLDAAARRRRDG